MTDFRPKIAIIDDEEDVRELYTAVLEEYFDVTSFADAQKAIDEIGVTNDFDAIITDLNMPGVDGFKLIERLKELHVDTPVVIATGYADKASAMKALKLGGFAILEKPINRTELQLISQRATVHHHLTTHNHKLINFFVELFNRLESTDKVELYLKDVKQYVEKLLLIQKDLEGLKGNLDRAS